MSVWMNSEKLPKTHCHMHLACLGHMKSHQQHLKYLSSKGSWTRKAETESYKTSDIVRSLAEFVLRNSQSNVFNPNASLKKNKQNKWQVKQNTHTTQRFPLPLRKIHWLIIRFTMAIILKQNTSCHTHTLTCICVQTHTHTYIYVYIEINQQAPKR
jgi:hypothetical protein